MLALGGLSTGEEDRVCARRGAPAERDSWCRLGRDGAPTSKAYKHCMNSRRLTWIASFKGLREDKDAREVRGSLADRLLSEGRSGLSCQPD